MVANNLVQQAMNANDSRKQTYEQICNAYLKPGMYKTLRADRDA